MPLLVKAIALVLSLKGIHLAYRACHEGKVMPSPKPIKTLIKIKNQNPLYANKGVTNENILSGLFFFPAYFVTYGTSIHAEYNASERKEHLLKIYNKKGCAKPKSVEYQKSVSNALVKLENLKKQYVKGAIEKENYIEMRRRILLEF